MLYPDINLQKKLQQNSTRYRTALYLRLSREDGDKTESDSIANQRTLLEAYAADHPELCIVDEFVDDGYSGSNFERPAFQRLFQELEQGTINCILVKDLSRFGRNYIEVGRYLERIFPVMRVRLIAVTDNYDSQSAWKTSDSIMVPMRNLLNDAYCRDISVKIKSQLAVKRKRGDFVGSFATYGYQKDPANHTKLIVDELAAETVQNIFRWKINGVSNQGIADRLNAEKAPSPAVRKLQSGAKLSLVKDFSRLGRNFVETGQYLEQVFPLFGVRFIAINDNYDSLNSQNRDGMLVPIKSMINEMYSKDLSQKIQSCFRSKEARGEIYTPVPFGYKKDQNRTGTIAKILNEKQIPTPAAYHVAENHVYSEQKAWDLQRSHWTSGTVYHVLKNEKYKGTYVGAKFIMPVPCKHRVLRAPLEQQVRIEDSHAAIVTPEEFEQAQKVIMLQHGNHQAGNYTKRQYPLKGKVYCGYCQKLMKYRVLKKLGPSFNCRFSATAVDSPCRRIPISEELLEEIVRNALTAQIKQAEHILEILHERERKALICFSALERQEEKLSAEKAEIVKQRVALYEQYADGNMSKEEFIRQRDAYRAQEDERMEQIQRLHTEKNQIFRPVKKDADHLQTVVSAVEESGDVMHLSQNVVETFIDRIEVFNGERVKIRFTFEDVLAGYAE